MALRLGKTSGLTFLVLVSCIFLCALVFSQNQSSQLLSFYGIVTVVALLGVWVGAKLSKGILARLFQRLGLWLTFLMTFEVLAALAFYANIGVWHCDYYLTLNASIYESHPYLVGMNARDADVTDKSIDYAHDENGWRNLGSVPEELPVVVTLGSSTTYGVGVPNQSCYPSLLQEKLAENYKVVNMGVGGYSSVENLIQTALLLPEYKPKFAIYMIGMNDARNARLKEIAPDYSNYHSRTLGLTMGLCSYLSANQPAFVKMSLLVAEKLDVVMLCPGMNYNISRWGGNETNPKALELFERNMREIGVLCEANGIEPIFVPEVIPGDVYPAVGVSGWFPFMDGRAVAETVQNYNLEMARICGENDFVFVEEILKADWSSNDFVDGWHPKPEANKKIADMVAKAIMVTTARETHNPSVDSVAIQPNP